MTCPKSWTIFFHQARERHGVSQKGVAGTVSLPIFSLFSLFPFSFRFLSVFFRFFPFSSFFPCRFQKKRGDTVRQTPFAKPRKKAHTFLTSKILGKAVKRGTTSRLTRRKCSFSWFCCPVNRPSVPGSTDPDLSKKFMFMCLFLFLFQEKKKSAGTLWIGGVWNGHFRESERDFWHATEPQPT